MKRIWLICITVFALALLASCADKKQEDNKASTEDEINDEADQETRETGQEDNAADDASDADGDRASDSEGRIVINEVCSKNDRGITAADGGYYDWIELYNMSDNDVNLKGYGLTDKMSEPFKFTFPDVILKAGEYLIVFANKEAVAGDGELLANFGISASGETVALFSPDRKIIDSIALPAMQEDVSYGRKPDGSDNLSGLIPTPNSSNNDADTASVEEPVFSAESGFYDERFMLSITAPEGFRIYYTTDGSLPSDRSYEYTSPIEIYDRSPEDNVYANIGNITTGTFYAPEEPVDKASIIRAVAYDTEGNPSRVVTKSYFIGYGDKAAYYKDTAVLSLVTDPNNLFNYDTGIYVTGAAYDDWLAIKSPDDWTRYWHQPANYKNGGMDWEKEAHIDFFDMGVTPSLLALSSDTSQGGKPANSQNDKAAFSQEVGIRLRGGASRAFLQKSFNIFARGGYGAARINYELFPGLVSEAGDKAITSFKSIMLRNGGNDTELTKFREVMIHRLSEGLNVTVQASRPVIVFLNGEYWGLYNLQERYSSEFIESHYGIDRDDVVIIDKGNIDEGTDEDIELYKSLIDFAMNKDLSRAENYEEICSMMDMNSFIDYVCIEAIIANYDWGTNNVRLWRSRTADPSSSNPYADGRWRFMIYDVDYSTGLSYENSLVYDAYYNPVTYEHDSLLTLMNSQKIVGSLFSNLIQNNTFKKQFRDRYMEIIKNEFKSDRVAEAVEIYAAAYADMMTDTLVRFKPLNEAKAREQYEYEVDKLRRFFNLRYDVVTGMVEFICR